MPAAAGGALADDQAPKGKASFMDRVIADTEKLVRIETYRTGDNESEVRAKLQEIEDFFKKKSDEFNSGQKIHKLSFFEWKSDDKKFWVFGFRAGKGVRKVSFLTHLDTVPPGNTDWKPFEPRLENRMYKGTSEQFLIGRGSIDDKGPAVATFEALTTVLKNADSNPSALDNVTFEILFDTSEETDMSTLYYFDKQPDQLPAFGVVFDAFWTVRAEKGIERPVFTIPADAAIPPSGGTLTLADLNTASGSVNMIPTSASARITGDGKALDSFAGAVEKLYRSYPFDDTAYHPAELKVSRDENAVILTTLVAGAQHGSAPEQNRVKGANPVVSLSVFLASLIDRGFLANNNIGEMCRFMRWGWGTRVFGESHPDLLERYDTVFKEGNGTTYALTRLKHDPNGDMNLAMDIRYAIGHHGVAWDGQEGQLKGESVFKSVFAQLVKQYKEETGGAEIRFTTATADAPDIRDPRGANFLKINNAYRAAMGENSPMYAIGGGTDAKNHLALIAAGALFTQDMGPPVNYHGLDEGAPIVDLQNSANILMSLMEQELNAVKKAPKN